MLVLLYHWTVVHDQIDATAFEKNGFKIQVLSRAYTILNENVRHRAPSC